MKITKTHYFMNGSVRRHLNEYKTVKKLEFLHFCQILDVFGHFNNYNHEKSTKIKVILEICAVKFGKSTNTPGVTLSAKSLSKKAENSVFHNIHPLKYAKYP